MVRSSCVKKPHAHGFPARMHTKNGGLAEIIFCGCMAKVRCLILCELPQLTSRIDRRAHSWLRKVGLSVNPPVVHIHTGADFCSASTIEHLKNTLQDGEVVMFFYCDFQNKRSTSPAEMMRSLLSQLLRHLHDHGLEPGNILNKILEEKSEGTLSLNDLDKLCDLISRAASFFRWEPIIVIDALDECADIEALLRALVTLNQGDVRLLVTSRPHEDMKRHFADLRSLSFENVGKELAADIALHVRREVDSHNRLRSADLEIKNEIRAKLSEKAEGR